MLGSLKVLWKEASLFTFSLSQHRLLLASVGEMMVGTAYIEALFTKQLIVTKNVDHFVIRLIILFSKVFFVLIVILDLLTT